MIADPGRITGTAALQRKNIASRLVRIVRRHSSVLISSMLSIDA